VTGQILRAALILCGVLLVAVSAMRLIDNVPHGDVGRGKALFNTPGSLRIPCVGCHRNAMTAPLMPGISSRVVQVRLLTRENAAKTAAQYLAESVVDPKQYVVPEYANNIEPTFFRRGLDFQDLQDIVAYLMTL
jgi:hypothetical protein